MSSKMAKRESANTVAISDWPTQLAVLKAMYNTEDVYVKYLDDENDEVRIENQNDYDFANQIAISSTNSVLRLILRNSRDEIIGKTELNVELISKSLSNSFGQNMTNSNESRLTSSIESMKSSIEKIMPSPPSNTTQPSTSSSNATTFTATQIQWLDNYLEKFKIDFLKEIKDTVRKEERKAETLVDEDLISFEFEHNQNLENKAQTLLTLIGQSRSLKRSLKTAYLEEELQSTGAFMAEFIKDQNMPDGTKCDPNVKFQKTWLIKNVGKLNWTDDKFPVKLVCIAGNIMPEGNVDCVNVMETRLNQTASVSVELIAPPVEGTYFSEWVLCCHGFTFGPHIWCTIEVTSGADANHSSDYNSNHEEENRFIESVVGQKKHHHLTSPPSPRSHHLSGFGAEDLDDEFVVIPDCFDLDKKWKQTQQQSSRKQKNDSISNDFGFEIETKPSLAINREQQMEDDLIMLNSNNANLSASMVNKSSLESSIEPINSSDGEMVNNNNGNGNKQQGEEELVLSKLVGDKLIMTAEETQDPKFELDESSEEATTNVDKIIIESRPQQSSPVDIEREASSSHGSNVNNNISQAFGAMKNAFSNLGRPSYVGSINLDPEIELNIPESNMNKLISMGFANRTLNLKLLIKHNQDMDKVIQCLLERHDNNWHENR